MQLSSSTGDAQHAMECEAHGGSHSHLNRMQDIMLRGKKSTVRLKFGNLDEKKDEKTEELPRPAKKPKKAGNRGRVSKAPGSAVNQSI